ncbi:MAG: WD40/YVTN/BNR-like repeat-containing protein [Terriglobales bacterium]
MKRQFFAVAIFLLVLILVFSVCMVAQSTPAAEAKTHDILENMKFRNLGPSVGGGRVAAVAGIPGNPNVYYVGAGGGGVWKTVDGGVTWKAVFEKEPTASIGAIAVAPSNSNLVWVGTGESNPRNDVITGKGVFFSPDGGATWKAMGLENAGAISQVIVHPTNPEIVYVGVLGHIWGPNPERGVFRTMDGGKTWQKVLYVGDKTGAIDLVMDPSNPMVLFAGMWEMQRYPWLLVSGGASSGIYRSTDGGTNWKKLSEGLPAGPLGRIGLAVAPSNGNHVYALIEAKKGTLWDSQDLGDHWKLVSSDPRLVYRGFYFTTLHVAPDNENHIYFTEFQILESFDGGKTASVTVPRGVHVDHHALWIDPTNAKRMINGNDGGAYVSTDAGKTWRFLDNLPIEQFYMVAFDDERPYLLCGGLQDNNGWCGPSNSLSRGGVSGADWFTVTGGDGEYIVPAGGKSGLVYASSQNGNIQRVVLSNSVGDPMRPYMKGVSDMATSQLKYRFNWTSPIAVSPKDPKTVYIGGNVLFKSTDEGRTWTPISPDLTRNDKTKQIPSGGPIELDLSGAETFGTLLSMAISPSDPNVIWVGTDDGLVQVTRDGGQHWSNVTPKGIPEWGRLQQIEVSPFSPETAYAAFDYHEVDNNKPYAFKTHDGGKTWTSIANGLPPNDPARVIRENPNQKGMLVLGTDAGLFYSYDDGATWKPMKSNFPTASIYDIKLHKQNRDLIVATHGRGLFVLDDISPLEQSTPQVLANDFHLYSTDTAGTRWRVSGRRDVPLGEFSAPNPPLGAVISYYLAKEIPSNAAAGSPRAAQAGETQAPPRGEDVSVQRGAEAAQQPAAVAKGTEPPAAEPAAEGAGPQRGPVKIVITDAGGQVVRTLFGPGKQGINRVAWNMRYDEAKRLNVPQRPEERELAELFGFGGGPSALPGDYKAAVTARGQTETTNIHVEPDPRFPFDAEGGKRQLAATLEVRGWVSALNEALNRIISMKAQIATVERLIGPDPETGALQNAAYTPVLEQARALQRKLTAFQVKVYNVDAAPGMGRLHALARFHDQLQSLFGALNRPYNQAPSPMVQEEMNDVRKQFDSAIAEFNTLLTTDVAAFNKLALEKGASTLFAGNPIQVKAAAGQAGGGH